METSAMEEKKIKQERGNEMLQLKIEWLEKTSLRRVFAQRSEEYEEGSHACIWEKSVKQKE